MMQRERETVIYGAQAVAYSTYRALKNRGEHVLAFLVTEKEDNPISMAGLPVLTWEEYLRKEPLKALTRKIYVATPENVQREIIGRLQDVGCLEVENLTSEKFGALMEAYFVNTGEFLTLAQAEAQAGIYQETYTSESIHIYQAVHEKDKQLSRKYTNAAWMKQIQVGAAVSGQRFQGVLYDDAGVNISAQNSAYAELTALYWAWQNSPAEVIGLAHYRRLLDINLRQLHLLQTCKLDAILPYPMSHFPQAENHHQRWVRDDDWEAIMSAMWDLYPEYAGAVSQIFSSEYFYNYNLLCARREVMDAYCSWLFAICKRAQQYIGNKEPSKMYKYFGYGGESLCDIFFMYNKDKYRLAHTTALMRI